MEDYLKEFREKQRVKQKEEHKKLIIELLTTPLGIWRVLIFIPMAVLYIPMLILAIMGWGKKGPTKISGFVDLIKF